MTYFPPSRPGVTSRIRLRGYDYASPGLYFITMCINDRSPRLGVIRNGTFHANAAGDMVHEMWSSIPTRFPGASLDAHCLMPNHLHGIVAIGIEEGMTPPFPSIPTIMNWIKSATTVEYIRGVREAGWQRFDRRLWQEGYHDYIIRADADLDRIREYIETNAANWAQDSLYLA